ncbi:2OG-Fe(II) oxygenase [Pelobium manganitolerans]|uniref:2OG-Fe(II) oxygenase n=1 Tax=Pelobium manganitolerans TaxID=1842495 RepID=UPI003FA3522D
MKTLLAPRFQDLMQVADDYAAQYQNANPFPSISFDDFFDEDFLTEVLHEFPDLSKKDSISFNDGRQVKLAGKGEANFGEATKRLMHFLNSEPFLLFLQKLTGIEEVLISDPYFFGGGQHEIKPGGLLKIHADFNKHPTMKLDRRINFLIYLSKDWKEEYGGNFELWDKNMEKCERKFLPVFNRIAMFSTTDFSYHGHPDPLNCPEGMSRKSLALYYYSNGRPASEVNTDLEKHNTLFKERKNNSQDVKAFKLSKKEQVKAVMRDYLPPVIVRKLLSSEN